MAGAAAGEVTLMNDSSYRELVTGAVCQNQPAQVVSPPSLQP
jgi:hypothetical protein